MFGPWTWIHPRGGYHAKMTLNGVPSMKEKEMERSGETGGSAEAEAPNRIRSDRQSPTSKSLPEPKAELTPFRQRVEQVKRDVDFDLVIRRMREIESQFEIFGHRPLELLDDEPPH